MPENHDAWRLMQAGVTQVRVAGMGGTIGYDYVALQILADSMGIEMPEAMWRKVRAIENVVRKIEAKQRKIDESQRNNSRNQTITPRRRR